VNVRRGRKELVLEWKASKEPGDYQYGLPLPGEIAIPELGIRIEARVVDVGSVPERERHGLLDPTHVGAELVIRNWRSGDRYWPAHTAAEKKVKELLGDRHATGAEKKLWPVATAEDGGLVWMRGFAAPETVRARTGKAIWIREIGNQEVR
jgi:tRNA(Ile)-lysidine synthase